MAGGYGLPDGGDTGSARVRRDRLARRQTAMGREDLHHGLVGGQPAPDSSGLCLLHAGVPPHMAGRQSSASGGLFLPQALDAVDSSLHGGSFSPGQNRIVSNGLAFPSVLQTLPGGYQARRDPYNHQPDPVVHHHYTSNNSHQPQPHQSGGKLPSRSVNVGPSHLLFQGYSLEQLKIRIGGLSDPHELQKTHKRVMRALQRPMIDPPVLPENTIGEMDPKQVFPDYVKLADDASREERAAAEIINNRIAAESQRVDRERNNEAAKRSRRLKSENLDNANQRLVDNAFHIAWLEAVVSSLGGMPETYYTIDSAIVQSIRHAIAQRRDACYEQRRKDRTKKETKKRSQRHKNRTRQKRDLNQRAARQYAEAAQAQALSAGAHLAGSPPADAASASASAPAPPCARPAASLDGGTAAEHEQLGPSETFIYLESDPDWGPGE